MASLEAPQIRVLHLKKGSSKKYDVHRLEKGCVLRFLLDSSLHNYPVRLFCNHPLTASTPFQRSTYHELRWRCSSTMRSALTDIYVEAVVSLAGSFNYFFTIDESASQSQAEGEGYFLVDPVLSINKKLLPLDAVCLQTVVTKLLGPFDQWESRLAVAKELGYNMIHFTPVQELGVSKSAFCIRDQHRLSFEYSTDERLTYLMVPHMKDLVEKLHDDWGVLSLTDLVLNHTALDSPLLERHPQCAYNLHNSPHLRPAYLLDRVFRHFSLEVAHGAWEGRGVPASLDQDAHFEAMRHCLYSDVLPKYKMLEFYLCDIDSVLTQFKNAVHERSPVMTTPGRELTLQQDPQFRRNMSTVDINLAVKLFHRDLHHHGDCIEARTADSVEKSCSELYQHLMRLNQKKEEEVWDHLHTAVNNFIKNGIYRFLCHTGPQLGCVTKDNPIMLDYFVSPERHQESVETAERMMNTEPELVWAFNGWVIEDKPLRNFAEESNVYLRRELIPWTDNIKLRYGQNPQDCPPLWEHMRIYAELSAQVFHGVRLDNAHSTPLHVGEYMLDAARRQRPDLYVMAELFTGDSDLDHYFINRLGINSLVREVMKVDSPEEMRRMVVGLSGDPVGAFTQPRVRLFPPSGAPAVFCDQTHDNQSPIESRSVYSLWPNSAVAAMTKCATGSNRGYDELVPHHIDVVKEKRVYLPWTKENGEEQEGVNLASGIYRGKRILNQLHTRLAMEGFSEIHVEDLHHGVIEVVRHNPITHQSVILVASLVFQHPHDPKQQLFCKPLHIEGVVEEVLFEGGLGHDPDHQYKRNDHVINGLPPNAYFLNVRENVHITRSHYCKEHRSANGVEIFFNNFTPGTIVALKCCLSDKAQKAVQQIRLKLAQFGHIMRAFGGNNQPSGSWETSSFRKVISHLNLGDMNRLLYRVGVEEEDDGLGFSTYNIPGYGNLCYCGLRGVMSVLGEVRQNNDLAHPLCQNLREGHWLMDYIVARMQLVMATKPLGDWFEAVFDHVKDLPHSLIPCYFSAVITGAYVVLREIALRQYSPFVRDGSTFIQALALSCTQFLGYVRTARLPPLSPDLQPSPRTEVLTKTREVEPAPVSMASGLPHFAGGHWRCWGRDTFIALRGMMLVTGRFSDARFLILAYGGTLRHGLIPNLLWEGEKARYNCRDAVWWWLQAIKAYTKMAPDGVSILHDPVLRVYPTDGAAFNNGHCVQPLHAVIQEALSRHMAGVQFRERDAGSQLDPYMTDEGFNVEVGVLWPKGYVYGGNVHNCGTWMDFMGRSHTAGNWGKPATPRDGSAVEMVALCASILGWLAELSACDIYPYRGVTRSCQDFKDELITFEAWSQQIKSNFERDFYISTSPSPAELHPERIVRRGMYKDCLNATQTWADYQLRPNFCVAMVVAPELFDEDKAWTALNLAQKVLMGPVGMKTLDPNDWNYCGHYCVHNDSSDPKVAAGYNYHNGPEFLWLLAYFLRAKLYFASRREKREEGVMRETVNLVNTLLSEHYNELIQSPWKSLPQLTNVDGAFCEDSCRAQAVSDGCVLELLYDLERLGTAAHPSVIDFQGPLDPSCDCPNP